MIRGIAFCAAAACAALMGFAIQRGATCTVAAVDQVLTQRRFKRLAALVEASLWVSGGLLILHAAGALVEVPTGYALTGRTLAGAALLGLGAFVNRACVFGAIARFGSGEWAYAATPLGFYLGCLAAGRLGMSTTPERLVSSSIVLGAPGLVGGLVAAWFAWRVGVAVVRGRRMIPTLVTEGLWAPHAATGVIGLAFLAMLLLVGSWAWTDAVAELARGSTRGLVARLLLAACLLAGAVLGGWRAGRLRGVSPGAAALLRCLAGGTMMGWGSLLIPGSNDGLILVGMPMLWPYAWLAFLTMCVSIGAAQTLQARLAARHPMARA
jgi:toxin CptA